MGRDVDPGLGIDRFAALSSSVGTRKAKEEARHETVTKWTFGIHQIGSP